METDTKEESGTKLQYRAMDNNATALCQYNKYDYSQTPKGLSDVVGYRKLQAQWNQPWKAHQLPAQ